MTRSSALAFAGVFAILATTTVLASDIYKYVDENGVVHYVDRPTGEATEQRVVVSTAPSTASRSSANSGPDWRERRQARQEARAAKEAERSEQEERKELCQQYRQRLEQYDNSPRLYRMDEQGERVYLDEEQIKEAREQVKLQIDKNCNA